jgi:hypothetical protein
VTLAKPFMQRFTGKELLAMDHEQEMGRVDRRCDNCKAGNPEGHQTFPNPCALSIKVEISRRVLKYDALLEALEDIAARRWWKF